MLTINNVTYSAGGSVIIKNFSWQTEGHSLILGKSGCGKTTLLNLIAGLLTPADGAIVVNGTTVSSLTAQLADRWRAAHIGMVFQRLHLIQALSIIDNLRLARYTAGLEPDDDYLQAMLSKAGIAHKAHAMPHQVSQGQAQRAAIVRAVATRPAWVLADEPTSSLDEENSELIISLLYEHAETCKAKLLIATHDLRIRHRFRQMLDMSSLEAIAA